MKTAKISLIAALIVLFALFSGAQSSCSFQNAYWSTSSTSAGTLVELVVESSTCDGESVIFSIMEDDTLSDETLATFPAVTADASGAKISWTAQYSDDGLLSGDPEYYFVAQAGAVTIQSGLLFVSQQQASQNTNTEISPIVNPDYSQLKVTLPSQGRIPVTLHPLSTSVQDGTPARVAFGVPFPPRTVSSESRIRVLDSNGAEIPSYVQPGAQWYDFNSLAQTSLRSAIVQFDFSFNGDTPQNVYIEYGVQRTQTLTNPVGDVTTLWQNVNSYMYTPMDYAAEESGTVGRGTILSAREPRVYATFEPAWLSASLIRTRVLPSGHLPALSWFDDAYLSYAYTAVNDLPASVLDQYKINFVGEEPQLFDRTSALYGLYIKTGDVQWLRHAHRAAEFYRQYIGADGWFDLSSYHEDLKYIYGEPIMVDSLFFGADSSSLTKIRAIAQNAEDFTDYYPTVSFWTERHAAYSLLGTLTAFEATGEAQYRDRARTFAQALFDDALHPANGWEFSGCIIHASDVHGEGGNTPICSPWMSQLLSDAVWQYYVISEDPLALEFLENLGHMVRQYALYRGPSSDGVVSNYDVPYYMASAEGQVTDGGSWADLEHTCDVAGMVARAQWAAAARGNDHTIMQPAFDTLMRSCRYAATQYWYRPGTTDRPVWRLSPARKFNWWFGTTSDMTWFQQNDDLVSTIPTQDQLPPLRFNGAPTGTVPRGTGIVTISVRTDEQAQCRYSATAGMSFASMQSALTANAAGTTHSAQMAAMDATSYNVYIRCEDAAGNINNDDYRLGFTVAGGTTSDTTAPSIQNVVSNQISTQGAHVEWTTDELSTSTLEYGTTTAYGNSRVSTAFATSHSYDLSGLTTGTTYYYRVSSTDAAGNTQSLSGYTFTTASGDQPQNPTETPTPAPSNSPLVFAATTNCLQGMDPHWQCTGRWVDANTVTADTFIAVCPNGASTYAACHPTDLFMRAKYVPENYGVFHCRQSTATGGRNGCSDQVYVSITDKVNVNVLRSSLGTINDLPRLYMVATASCRAGDDPGWACSGQWKKKEAINAATFIGTCPSGASTDYNCASTDVFTQLQNVASTAGVFICYDIEAEGKTRNGCEDMGHELVGAHFGSVPPAPTPAPSTNTTPVTPPATESPVQNTTPPAPSPPATTSNLVFVATSSCVQGQDPHYQCSGMWKQASTVTADTFIAVCPTGAGSYGACHPTDGWMRAKYVPAGYGIFHCRQSTATGGRNGCSDQVYVPITEKVNVNALRSSLGTINDLPRLYMMATASCKAGDDPGWACSGQWKKKEAATATTFIGTCPGGASANYNCASTDTFVQLQNIPSTSGVFVCYDIEAEGKKRNGCEDVGHELVQNHFTDIPPAPAPEPVQQSTTETSASTTQSTPASNQLVFAATTSCMQGQDPHWQCGARWKRVSELTADSFVGVCPAGASSTYVGCYNTDYFLDVQYIPDNYGFMVCKDSGEAALGKDRNGCNTVAFETNVMDLAPMRSSLGSLNNLHKLVMVATENCDAGDDPDWACGGKWKRVSEVQSTSYIGACASGPKTTYHECSQSDGFQQKQSVASGAGVLTCHDISQEGLRFSLCEHVTYESYSTLFG